MNERNARRFPFLSVSIILILLIALFSLLGYVRQLRAEKQELLDRAFTPEDASVIAGEYEGQPLPDGDAFYRASTLREMADEAYSITELMSMLHPDKLVYYNSEVLVYDPISEALKRSEIDFSGMADADGRRSFTLPDGTKALTGVDVSSWQGAIDWQKVKADGIDFAILRAGLRGYGTAGKLSLDNEIYNYLEGTKAAGIPVGVYFYTMAVNEAEALEEADLLLEAIRGYDVTWPVIVDVELPSEKGRTDDLSPARRTDIVIAFCERVREAGYVPMIYANMRTFAERLELERLEGYEKWFAQYFSRPYYPYDFGIWQYSSSGTVDGIRGGVDLNLAFRDYGAGN